jgi:hypothetical protein
MAAALLSDADRNRVFPEPFHIAHGREAEETFVFPAEVGCIIVSHTGASTGSVEMLPKHQATRLLQPQPLLIL